MIYIFSHITYWSKCHSMLPWALPMDQQVWFALLHAKQHLRNAGCCGRPKSQDGYLKKGEWGLLSMICIKLIADWRYLQRLHKVHFIRIIMGLLDGTCEPFHFKFWDLEFKGQGWESWKTIYRLFDIQGPFNLVSRTRDLGSCVPIQRFIIITIVIPMLWIKI